MRKLPTMNASQHAGAETSPRCLSVKACAASWLGLSMGAWLLIGGVAYLILSTGF